MAKQASPNATPSAQKASVGKTRKRAVSNPAPEVESATPEQPSTREPSYGEIAEHAYGLYLARGAGDGAAISDWLRAEYELRTKLSA